MNLIRLPLKTRYHPDNCDDIIAEFYAPALAHAVAYSRTTYGFNPSGLAAAAAGLMPFLEHNGRIQLICDDDLDGDVLDAIRRGITTRQEALLAAFPPQSLVLSHTRNGSC